MISINKIRLFFILFLISTSFGISQNIPKDSLHKFRQIIPPLDSIRRFIPDSLKAKQPDLSKQKDSTTISKKGSLDTLLSLKGRDSITFNMKSQIIRIYGDAQLNYRKQQLKSYSIKLNLKDAEMEAEPKIETNKIKQFPVFNDNGEEFYGKIIKYNFRSKKGVIDLGETKVTDGFYFGQKIKKISENELFVKDGCYTTCDAPQPHYYFGSPKMKIVAQDKVFVDPLIFYVEDIPIFVVPFGFYLPNKSGRQSGLIVPGYFFSNDRGVVLENFGFYWAASDYWDTQFAINFYSKGGAIFKNTTRAVIGDDLNGNVTFQYGKTRQKPDNPYVTNWSFAGNYSQKINPMENINANFNFASQDFNRNTQTSLNERITQYINSNIAYSKNFENGTSLSLSYQRNQNIITNEYNQVVPLNYSIPNFYPFKQWDAIPRESWVKDVSFSLSTTGSYSQDYSRVYNKKIVDTTLTYDTTFASKEKKYISYSPRLSISPKFGYFSVSPSISFAANTFFRKLQRSVNLIDSSIVDNYQNGLFWEYWYSLSIAVSTKLYGLIDSKHKFLGLINPEAIGMKAFRHTYNPTFSFAFSPDFSKSNYGFYDTYFDPIQQSYVKYSKFINEGGSHSPNSLSQTLYYNDLHSFEIKLPSVDTLPEKKIELLRLNFSTGYNFASDSLRFSPVNIQFRSPALDFINFTGYAGFVLYDEDAVFDKISGLPTKQTHFVNRFLLSEGKGLMRLTNLSLSFSTSFSSEGINSTNSFSKDISKKKKDTLSPGDRFSQRLNEEEEFFDYFGEATPGYSPISVPWSFNTSVSFSYNQPTINQITRSLNISGGLSFSLTNTWKIKATTQYDIINKQLMTPYITVSKDLHCWELLFTWSPSTYNGGFYLKFGIKAPQLKDLKLEKRNNPLYR